MDTGRIVTWKGEFGFIRQEQGNGDVYVNVRNMHPELRELAANGRIQGARVQFTVEPVPGRNPRAINVRGFITVPENLTRVLPPTEESWEGTRKAYIHEAWNTKNPRGSGPESREALETGEYFRAHYSGEGKYHSRSATHKSLAGVAAMVDGLFEYSLDNQRATLWVHEASGVGYVFAPSIPEITQQVWHEAAAFAGLKNIRVVVAEKFTAYTLVAFKGWLTEKARFEVRRVTGLVYDGVVRFQYKWQKVELPDVPTEFMPASASSLIAAMAACKSDEYQRKHGLEAQALLALFAVWPLDTVKSAHTNLQGLIGPEASDAVVTEAQASLQHLASMTDQDPLSNYGVRLETTQSGATFVVGWIKFKSGREELVPIQSYRSASGWGRPLHFVLDLTAHGHGIVHYDVQDHDNANMQAILKVGHSGWVAKSTDLEAEIVRIQAEEVEKARQARIAKAGQPELRLVGPIDRPFAEVVEYDGNGDETILTMVGFSCPDRYNHWVKAQRADGSTVEIRIGYDDKVMTNAASRSWQMLQPRCSGCGEIIFQMGPAHARWDTCGNVNCSEERKRRGRK